MIPIPHYGAEQVQDLSHPHTVNFSGEQRGGRARWRHAACPEPLPRDLQETSLFSKVQLQETQDAKAPPNNSCPRCAQPCTEVPQGSLQPGDASAPICEHRAGVPQPPPPLPWGQCFFRFCHSPLHFSFRSDSFPLCWVSSWVCSELCRASYGPGRAEGRQPSSSCHIAQCSRRAGKGDTSHPPYLPPLQKGEPQPRDRIAHQSCTLPTSHFPVLGAIQPPPGGLFHLFFSPKGEENQLLTLVG